MKLSAEDAQKNVIGVRISRRQGFDDQAANVKISIGSSEAYDAGDPVCTIIPTLTQQGGSTMVNYKCDKGLHSGEYVIFSNGGDYLTICEAAIMTQPKNNSNNNNKNTNNNNNKHKKNKNKNKRRRGGWLKRAWKWSWKRLRG